MDRVELHIQGSNGHFERLELEDGVNLEFNINFGDLTNPTTTKIPFSTQVNVPMTPDNNRIFSNIWRLDHSIQSFNPLKRVAFRLYIDSNLYEIGYIKLETVDKTYNIRLFGGLGDYFYTMSNIKIRDLDWSELEHYVDRKQVERSFSDSQNNRGVSNLNGNYIGDKLKYALTYQGKYDDFDNKSIATNDSNGAKVIEEVKWLYGNKTFQSVDLKEHHRTGEMRSGSEYYGEFRSYYQRPALRVQYIFDKILDRMTKEGWKTNLDSSFFNITNPYWNDTWVIKKQYKVDGSKGIGVNIEIPRINEQLDIEGAGYNYSGNYVPGKKGGFELKVDSGHKAYITMPLKISKSTWDTTNPLDIRAIIKFRALVTEPTTEGFTEHTMKKRADDFNMYAKCYIQHTNKANGRVSRVYLKDIDSVNNLTIKFNDDGKNNNSVKNINSKYNNITKDHTTYYVSSERDNQEFGFEGSGIISSNNLDATFENNKFDIVFEVWGTTYWRRVSHGWYTNYGTRFDLLGGTEVSVNSKGEDNATRSSRLIKAENIFQDDKSCFEFLTSYCKMFGLMFDKDPVRKEVNILTRPTFFQGLNMVNWSEKMDRKEPYELTPVPFEYRYGVFKYNDKKTKYEEDYLSKTGNSYGSLKFDNGLEHTDVRKDYIEKIIFDNAVKLTEKSQYYLGRSEDLLADNKSLFHLENNSGSKVDADYILCFFAGNQSVRKRFIITDDTEDMLVNGYCWTDRAEAATKADTYPKFTREIGQGEHTYSLKFGRPQLAYDEDDLVASHTSPYIGYETIYRRFWSDFINGRFDQNNKVLKAKFNINSIDIIDIFRKFVRIDNTLWVVDKVSNFSPLNNNLTDVELIKVKDINNFVKQHLDIPDFIITDEYDNVIYDFAKNIGKTPIWLPTDVNSGGVLRKKLYIKADTDWIYKKNTLYATLESGDDGSNRLVTFEGVSHLPFSSGTISFNNGIGNIGLVIYQRDFNPLEPQEGRISNKAQSINIERTSASDAKLDRPWITDENRIR